jgi:ribonuclease P/MRP protein subunit RPP1
MRRFIDLHVQAPEDPEKARPMFELAARLGFKGVGLAMEGSHQRDLKAVASAAGIDPVSRVDLAPKNTGELTAALRRLRRRFEIVAVESRSKKVARQAAKDHRVDILNFPSSLSARSSIRLDRQEASLASDANCAYEINVADLLGQDWDDLSRLISLMRTEVDTARRFDVPIIVSSGARGILQMRDPRGLAAVSALLDLDDDEGLDAVSKTPMGMVENNRGKLDTVFVAPGVRRV